MNNVQHTNQRGFTLIELLVVIVILGILAAIAVPVFLNQRIAAWKATVVSDVHNAAKQVELASQDAGGSVSDIEIAADTSADDTVLHVITNESNGSLKQKIAIGSQPITISPDNKITLTVYANNKYRIVGEQPSNLKGWQYVYESDKGTGEWVSPAVDGGLYVTGMSMRGGSFSYGNFRRVTDPTELANAHAMMTGDRAWASSTYEKLLANRTSSTDPGWIEFIYAGDPATTDIVYTAIPSVDLREGHAWNAVNTDCSDILRVNDPKADVSYDIHEDTSMMDTIGMSWDDATLPPATMPANADDLTAAARIASCRPVSPKIYELKRWVTTDGGQKVTIDGSTAANVRITNTYGKDVTLLNDTTNINNAGAGRRIVIPANGEFVFDTSDGKAAGHWIVADGNGTGSEFELTLTENGS